MAKGDSIMETFGKSCTAETFEKVTKSACG
jgi:hypothetical protein